MRRTVVSISYLIIFFSIISCLSGKEQKNVEEKISIEEIDIRQLPEYNFFRTKDPLIIAGLLYWKLQMKA